MLEKLSVEAIASAAPLSSWHFQRVFRLLVGETVGSYIRKRRLSRSVEALLESDRCILDIALSHGFESQQAYTRAFRAQFRTPPGRFRERGELFTSLPALSAERLRQDQRMQGCEPRFVDRGPTDYLGVEGRFRSAIADQTPLLAGVEVNLTSALGTPEVAEPSERCSSVSTGTCLGNGDEVINVQVARLSSRRKPATATESFPSFPSRTAASQSPESCCERT